MTKNKANKNIRENKNTSNKIGTMASYKVNLVFCSNRKIGGKSAVGPHSTPGLLLGRPARDHRDL
jgi:hypothetical protein